MKISSVLKVVGAAAAVAALTPYQVKKDEETGVTTMKALLWGVQYTPATKNASRDVNVNLGLHLPKVGKAANDEAELFADDDPNAAVLDADTLETIAEEAKEAVTDAAQEAAGVAQAVVEDIKDAAEARPAPEF